jgi:hypothetical protein
VGMYLALLDVKNKPTLQGSHGQVTSKSTSLEGRNDAYH